MSGASGTPEPGPASTPAAGDSGSLSTHEFRWQGLFQRSADPLFVLNRRRRIVFVNHAWEKLTGVPAAEARGLACLRRVPQPDDPPDLIVRALCSPPPEALQGKAAHARRLVPPVLGSSRWWDIEFLPLRDAQGLLGIMGRITSGGNVVTTPYQALPERLIGLREAVVERYRFGKLTSSVPAVLRAFEQARLASQVRAPVLLIGEPGVGKQWLARTIHYEGLGRDAPFAALDCRILPEPTLNMVLFGEGGLTRPGHGGTLYLKEPQALPRDLQARLSQFLAHSSGADGPRLIAGCARPSAELVRAGQLREDLCCSLSTLTIELPPLRERLADLPVVVRDLLERTHSEAPGATRDLTAAAWELVGTYAWPGNLSELLTVLQAASARALDRAIDVEDLPAYLRLAVRLEQTPGAEPERLLPLDSILEEAERRLIQLALRRAHGNRSQAAEILKIWRARLSRRMEALGIGDGEKSEPKSPST